MRILTHGNKYNERWYLVQCDCSQILPFLHDTDEFFCPNCATLQGADTLVPAYKAGWRQYYYEDSSVSDEAFWFDELPDDEEWSSLAESHVT